jgi:predicted  nucleic acid-binding Zn ribbon protein
MIYNINFTSTQQIQEFLQVSHGVLTVHLRGISTTRQGDFLSPVYVSEEKNKRKKYEQNDIIKKDKPSQACGI